MFLTPYTRLAWAYHLHYHLCFRTHRRRKYLDSNQQFVTRILDTLFELHGYHPLRVKPRPSDLQLLLSLKPEHRISDVLKKLKGESSKVLCHELAMAAPFWGRGYLARSSGRATLRAVRQYLEKQAEHHGYANRVLPPVFRFRAVTPKALAVAHGTFDLKHHVVFATRFRRGVFDSKLGAALVKYWIRVGEKRRFALDQATVLPDHVHLLVRIKPNMSIEECALLLMNNGQHFVGKKFPERLIEARIDQLWESSAYAGTCGELSTALLKSFLETRE